MDRSRRLAGVAVAVVVAASVLSGPLVGAVDLTPPEPAPPGDLGTGSANVTLVSAPDSIRLVRGAFDSGTYHLESSPAVVRVGEVSGTPFLEYVIHVPALGFADVRAYVLSDVSPGLLRLSFRPVEFSPRRVSGDAYEGTVEIRLQADGVELLYESTVTIRVRP